MQRKLSNILLGLSLVLSSIGAYASFNVDQVQVKEAEICVEQCAQESYVYICNGPCSKRYHSTPSCTGLKNCSTKTQKVKLSYAKKKGRTPCKMCVR